MKTSIIRPGAQNIIKESLNKYGKVFTDEPLSAHTSFKTGGAAKVFFMPDNENGLICALEILKSAAVTPLIIGNGTNVIFSDNGFDGIIICIGSGLNEISLIGNTVIAQSGALLSEVAAAAARAGLSGFEALSGIPGTIGGAIFMNAGAYNHEINDIVASVRAYRMESGEISEYDRSELGFAYRTSRFQNSGEIILDAVFTLSERVTEDIRADMSDYAQRRRDKQPVEMPSAGSFFKRPPGEYAGALIEAAGLKGLSVGGACVSEKHAGFIVNTGNATTGDIIELMERVQGAVFKQRGIMLEPEPLIIDY